MPAAAAATQPEAGGALAAVLVSADHGQGGPRDLHEDLGGERHPQDGHLADDREIRKHHRAGSGFRGRPWVHCEDVDQARYVCFDFYFIVWFFAEMLFRKLLVVTNGEGILAYRYIS